MQLFPPRPSPHHPTSRYPPGSSERFLRSFSPLRHNTRQRWVCLGIRKNLVFREADGEFSEIILLFQICRLHCALLAPLLGPIGPNGVCGSGTARGDDSAGVQAFTGITRCRRTPAGRSSFRRSSGGGRRRGAAGFRRGRAGNAGCIRHPSVRAAPCRRLCGRA